MSGKKKDAGVDLGYLGDKKLEKGKKQLVEQSQGWKGPSHKERNQDQKETKRNLAKAASRHAEKVSWRKKCGGIAALFFICGVGLFQFISTVSGFLMGNGVTIIDVHDTAQLKAVLFSGEPWLVYCVNNVTQEQRLPQVLEDSAWNLKRNLGLRVGVLNCWDQTESGRSVAQRFKLKTSPPLAFVVANGNKPRLLNLVGTSKPEQLEKKVKPALKIETYRIDTLKKWPSLCTSRRACVVVGHRQNVQRDTALTVLRPLLESHRAVKVVTLDTSFWQLKLDDVLLNTRPASSKGGKGVDVLCLAREEGARGGNATYRGSFLQSLDASSASAFLSACDKQADLIKIPVAPKINARPSKPKKAAPAPSPGPRPAPSPPSPKPRDARSNVDHVGSRAQMEAEDEVLFEAVDEEEEEDEGASEEGEGAAEEGEEEEDSDAEVEL
mmetsp:Transcript_96172/g.206351  ORF Transcript_96172/g.206351 Transcript_96172/m.206351 type:complete len:439 (+) Transcript_96172:46-1362(+)|eukprot:CAMPEP_0180621352 /NCGR_PEP_ID=MMETSP1037_2-20121125/35096_1 /TAXON_ID=632150 /ORGANISM="Azadinium spinosum, Strain 3D9" /LENGTH=438 /DNA_ID=CAMNT_0022641509 /DNA_START=46 /DNA_END=1362 /DNA_ORIENTATION=+